MEFAAMGSRSDDITPDCEQPPATRKENDGRQGSPVPAISIKSYKLFSLLQKSLKRAIIEAPRALLWQRIAAALDCIQRVAAAAQMPSGCELPHCHHASSLGRYSG